MRKGFVVPYADSRDFADLAALGEEHGWDGIFTWEALWGVDAWVSLAAGEGSISLGEDASSVNVGVVQAEMCEHRCAHIFHGDLPFSSRSPRGAPGRPAVRAFLRTRHR